MRLCSLPWMFIATALALGAAPAPAHWPQFRADSARSGYTSATIGQDLALRWVYEPVAPPRPAWVGPDTRAPFDYAPQPVASQGLLFYGDSVDGNIRCLDGQTGRTRWEYATEAPVRFAPAVWGDHVFAASDDGYLYCLTLLGGDLVWKKRGGPRAETLLGNERLISRWPARGGVAVADGVVYFAAGIWPTEGIYLMALDAGTGEEIWRNDSAGSLVLDQPHLGARAESGVSIQGYLTVSGDTLLAPTGRAMPAAFERDGGAFRYFHLQAQGSGAAYRGGGPFIAMADGLTFNDQDLFQTDNGAFILRGVPSLSMAMTDTHLIYAVDGHIHAIARDRILQHQPALDRRGEPTTQTVLGEADWSIPCDASLGLALIVAGDTIIAGAEDGRVLIADRKTRTLTGALEVDGAPMGLAVSEGRLFVAADTGKIYAFSPAGDGAAPEPVFHRAGPPDGARPRIDPQIAVIAARILRQVDCQQGYFVDFGAGDGALSHALAVMTGAHIIAIESDLRSIRAMRQTLSADGLYGTRVTVLQRDLAETGLPDYLADVIVSRRALEEGSGAIPFAESYRLLKPFGGQILIGREGFMVHSTRGPLEGAGAWTHQYADPANTNCSDDALVRAPLRMLWFKDNTFEMPSRHGRGPAPLFLDGAMYVAGLHGVTAMDAYNGVTRWTRHFPNLLTAYDQEHLNGVAITGSNLCVGPQGLFLRLDDGCLRLDLQTGETLDRYALPGSVAEGADDNEDTTNAAANSGRAWGWLALDQGRLLGSEFDTSHTVAWAYGRSDMSAMFSESQKVFAIDIASSQTLWTHRPTHSIRNNTLAAGLGKVFFIDRPQARMDRRDAEPAPHPTGALIALDAATGEEAWRRDEDIYGAALALSPRHNVLIMSYQPSRFSLASEQGDRMTALRADDGEVLWDIAADYRSRLVLNDQTIYAEPSAWDLLTGEQQDFAMRRSYGCGTIAGSRHLLTFRSATLGFWDLAGDLGGVDYGGIRPGCWINAVPAGGLLLMPEATNRCTCSYLIKATVALQPVPEP